MKGKPSVPGALTVFEYFTVMWLFIATGYLICKGLNEEKIH